MIQFTRTEPNNTDNSNRKYLKLNTSFLDGCLIIHIPDNIPSDKDFTEVTIESPNWTFHFRSEDAYVDGIFVHDVKHQTVDWYLLEFTDLLAKHYLKLQQERKDQEIQSGNYSFCN